VSWPWHRSVAPQTQVGIRSTVSILALANSIQPVSVTFRNEGRTLVRVDRGTALPLRTCGTRATGRHNVGTGRSH